MARENRHRLRKKFVYFFLNGKVHKVLKLSRAKDEVIAWSYLDKKRMMYSYSQVDKNMEKAYTILEASKILGRHRVTVENIFCRARSSSPKKYIQLVIQIVLGLSICLANRTFWTFISLLLMQVILGTCLQSQNCRPFSNTT